MKKLFLFTIITLIFSCVEEKVIQLPEITYTDISEIHDVSPGYLFYNEEEADGVELNRKNLIVTTNWLINVDKRLTLEQVIPHITFLQEKKRDSSHKNDSAKNYFTCNNTSKSNLGFMEFTEVIYHQKTFLEYVEPNSGLDFSNKMKIVFNNSEDISVEYPLFDLDVLVLNQSNFQSQIQKFRTNETAPVELILCFNQNTTFQDYISFKSMVSTLNVKNISISNNEFISN